MSFRAQAENYFTGLHRPWVLLQGPFTGAYPGICAGRTNVVKARLTKLDVAIFSACALVHAWGNLLTSFYRQETNRHNLRGVSIALLKVKPKGIMKNFSTRQALRFSGDRGFSENSRCRDYA